MGRLTNVPPSLRPGAFFTADSTLSALECTTSPDSDACGKRLLQSSKPTEKPLRWADLGDSDGESTVCSIAGDNAAAVQTAQQIAEPAANLKKRWVDLEDSDDDSARNNGTEEVEAEMAQSQIQVHDFARQQKKRPTFGKPTREARVRQALTSTEEFCALRFDDVDASCHMSLTGRMLVQLKGLAETVSYWNKEGTEKHDEETFRLLDLAETDMYAIGKVIRKAGKLIEERKFRDAYNKLCEARPWFDAPSSEALEAQRTELRSAAAEQRTRMKASSKKECKDPVLKDVKVGEEAWTVVGNSRKEKVSNTDRRHQAHEGDQRKQGGHRQKAERHSEEAPTKVGTLPHTQNQKRNGQRNADRRMESRSEKFLCRFPIGIEEDSRFRVVGRLIGPGGERVKQIALESGAKLRIRGRGSNFLEGPEKKESTDPLMMCVSAPSQSSFDCAAAHITELLETVYEEYREFCKQRGQRAPQLAVRCEAQPKC